MPTFATPNPVSLTVDIALGDVTILAGDRSDTVVTVEPVDQGNSFAVQAALATRVTQNGGTIAVEQHLPWYKSFDATLPISVVSIRIELPALSSVRGRAALGNFHSEGPLGACELDLSNGDVALDTVGALTVKGSNGHVSAHSASGDVEIKTSNGAIALGEVVSGKVKLTTSLGGIAVGVRQGTAASLDAKTKLGTVQNDLEGVAGPDGFVNTVKIHARTNVSDIIIRRAGAPVSG